MEIWSEGRRERTRMNCYTGGDDGDDGNDGGDCVVLCCVSACYNMCPESSLDS